MWRYEIVADYQGYSPNLDMELNTIGDINLFFIQQGKLKIAHRNKPASIITSQLQTEYNLDPFIYPNPTNGGMMLKLDNKLQPCSVDISIYDVLGKVVWKTRSQITSGVNIIPIDFPLKKRISSGKYYLSINGRCSNYYMQFSIIK